MHCEGLEIIACHGQSVRVRILDLGHPNILGRLHRDRYQAVRDDRLCHSPKDHPRGVSCRWSDSAGIGRVQHSRQAIQAVQGALPLPPIRVGLAVEPRSLSSGSEFLRSITKGGSVIRNSEALGTGSFGGLCRDCRQMTVGSCCLRSLCVHAERAFDAVTEVEPENSRVESRSPTRQSTPIGQTSSRPTRANKRGNAGEVGRLETWPPRRPRPSQGRWTSAHVRVVRRMRIDDPRFRTESFRLHSPLLRRVRVSAADPAQSRPGSASPPWAASRGP